MDQHSGGRRPCIIENSIVTRSRQAVRHLLQEVRGSFTEVSRFAASTSPRLDASTPRRFAASRLRRSDARVLLPERPWNGGSTTKKKTGLRSLPKPLTKIYLQSGLTCFMMFHVLWSWCQNDRCLYVSVAVALPVTAFTKTPWSRSHPKLRRHKEPA